MDKIINRRHLIDFEIERLKFCNNVITEIEEIEERINDILNNPLKNIEKYALFKIKFG